MPVPRHLAVLALVASLATGCGSDGGTPVAQESTAPPAPSVVGSPSPQPSPAASVEAGTTADPAFPADTRRDEQEPSGGALTVTKVRVAAQDGYDRVVLELAGDQSGQPGWFVEYSDDPRQQGSGEPVEVDGDAVLSVYVRGVGYPFDTGVDEVSGRPVLPPGLTSVTDVRLGSTFEGQYEAYIGTSGTLPFRVFRLSNPARVVIDVRHA